MQAVRTNSFSAGVRRGSLNLEWWAAALPVALLVKVTVLEMGKWGGTVAVLAQGCRHVWGQDRKTI